MTELKDEINELTDKLRQKMDEQKNLEEERYLEFFFYNDNIRLFGFVSLLLSEIIFLNNLK